ncbi:hypothetical protein [Bacillus atrophaeus]|uniref:hypothetical protein n=1 Tax=Bacillus atrophaeus TaxID=1452 RepID=UPI0037BF0E62
MNRSVKRLLRTVMKSQLLLQTKLEDIIYLQESESCIAPEDPGDSEDREDPEDPDDSCDPYHPESPHRHDPRDDLFYGRIDCCECEECEECDEQK